MLGRVMSCHVSCVVSSSNPRAQWDQASFSEPSMQELDSCSNTHTHAQHNKLCIVLRVIVDLVAAMLDVGDVACDRVHGFCAVS